MDHHDRFDRQLTRDAGRLGGFSLWLAFRALPALVVAALLVMWAVPGLAMAPGQSGEPTLDDLASGHMLLHMKSPGQERPGQESPGQESPGQERPGQEGPGQEGPGQENPGRESLGHYTPAILQASKVHLDISGMIATVVVEQSFLNDGGRALEGVYAFPLPDDAAVRYMEMVIGERRIVGKIRERAEARKIYSTAKAQGRKASLVEQQRPNLFTNRVANIGAGESITVRLEYVQQVALDNGEFSLRFPTTLTPRYMPGAPLGPVANAEDTSALTVIPGLGWAVPTDQVPDADAVSPFQFPQQGDENTPLNPLEVSVRLDMGMPLARVEAPYHEIALARRAGVYDIRLANGVTEMDRDFVLTWQPVTGSAPKAALFTEEVAGEYYGLLMVLPPAAERAGPAPAREIIFVVDTSGSMGGVSIAQARDSVSRALRQLRPEDRFNIIAFDSSHRALYRRSVPATRHHVQQAREFVRMLRASGGTEMLPALRAALDPPRDSDGPGEQPALRQVIFITDGAVGNEMALFEEISARIGHSRLFTVGIGSAPNSWFMREAARYGRGSHTHIGALEEVGDRMTALFAQLSRPAAVDLDVSWPGQERPGQERPGQERPGQERPGQERPGQERPGQERPGQERPGQERPGQERPGHEGSGDGGAASVEAWPQRLPDLYLGQPLLVAVRFGTDAPTGEVVVSGDVGGRPWRQTLALSVGVDPLTAPRHKGVASLWARRKIAGLLDGKILGRSEQAVRAEVLPVALAHQLLSPYTSFVAVEEIISLPPGEQAATVPVPNTRPRGQAPQTFAYPRTATTGPAKAWFGMLLLFSATVVRLMRQPELDHVPTPRD